MCDIDENGIIKHQYLEVIKLGQLYFNEELEILDNDAGISRIAYIDESGDLGFDFSKNKTSRFYIICAIIIDRKNEEELEKKAEAIRRRNFGDSEIKSSEVGSNVKRRIKILSEMIHVDFNVLILIIDKKKIYDNSPLKMNKSIFLKYLHNKLYQKLYHMYPKLLIYFDELGRSEFQDSFKKYVEKHRPKYTQYNIFNEYDFDFLDDKKSVFIQFADFIAGTVNRKMINNDEAKYLRIIKGNTLGIFNFPENYKNYYIDTNSQSSEFSKDIFRASYNSAMEFINSNEGDENEDIRLQVEFVNYLLYQYRFISPNNYVYSNEIMETLSEYRMKKVNRDEFFRKIVPSVRDEGVIIASSPKGYKIPDSEKDMFEYVNQTIHVTGPMLNRLGLCRDTIFRQTEGKLDILNKAQFIKYRKYFD